MHPANGSGRAATPLAVASLGTDGGCVPDLKRLQSGIAVHNASLSALGRLHGEGETERRRMADRLSGQRLWDHSLNLFAPTSEVKGSVSSARSDLNSTKSSQAFSTTVIQPLYRLTDTECIEVGADQKQNQPGRIELFADPAGPFRPDGDVPIIPPPGIRDHPRTALERGGLCSSSHLDLHARCGKFLACLGKAPRRRTKCCRRGPQASWHLRSYLTTCGDLIQSTRSGLAQAVNSALVVLYWQVGYRIRTDVLKSKAGNIRGRDLFDAVERIGGGVWKRLFTAESDAHDPFRGSISGSGSGRGALAAVELEPFRRTDLFEGRASKGFLRRNVPD